MGPMLFILGQCYSFGAYAIHFGINAIHLGPMLLILAYAIQLPVGAYAIQLEPILFSWGQCYSVGAYFFQLGPIFS